MIGMFDGYGAKKCEVDDNKVTTALVQKDLIGEIDAVLQYNQHIAESKNRLANRTWEHIKNEELVHIGELLALRKTLSPSDFGFVEDGMQEFLEHKTQWERE